MLINKLLKFQGQIKVVLIVVKSFLLVAGWLNRGGKSEWRVYVFQEIS
jgi:hypothetical protein